MARFHEVKLEIVRPGPAHGQLLSPLTPYLALCGAGSPTTFHVRIEQHKLLGQLEALRCQVPRVRDAMLLEVGRDVRLELNSLGQPAERLAHRAALIAHFEAHAAQLDEDAKRRLHSNPLRILDSKNPAMQALIESAPKLADFLGAESLAHFDALRAVLDAAGLAYRINPRLVRGMDYYNLTVFEWVTDQLGSQGTVCGGGRYDGLFEQLGGRGAPALADEPLTSSTTG